MITIFSCLICDNAKKSFWLLPYTRYVLLIMVCFFIMKLTMKFVSHNYNLPCSLHYVLECFRDIYLVRDWWYLTKISIIHDAGGIFYFLIFDALSVYILITVINWQTLWNGCKKLQSTELKNMKWNHKMAKHPKQTSQI